MTEWDVDAQIKRYWASKERMIPDEFLEKLEELFPEFRDASQEDPVRAAEFLSHLDLNVAEKFLDSLYRRKPRYPAKAMVKSLLLMQLKGMRFYTELERYLMSHEDEAAMIGFPVEDGHVAIPSDKNLWHFASMRIGKVGWDRLFIILRDAVVSEAKSLGIPLGERTVEDAMPVEALDGDQEAEYSAYYERRGYKLDTVTDLEEGVPLSKKVTGIKEDESRNLIPHLSEMKSAGIEVRDHWFDGGYADYGNIAWMGTHGIEAHYHIHENWVRNERGSVESIMGLYQGYWEEHLCMEERMRVKGLEKVDRYLTMNLCAVLAVALCRLQHGIKESLTSIAYLT